MIPRAFTLVLILLGAVGILGSQPAGSRITWRRTHPSDLQQHYLLNAAEARRLQTLNLSDVVDVLTIDSDYSHLVQAALWLVAHPAEAEIFLPALPEMLRDTSCVGLTNSADLIIWDRIQTGELVFWGHGGGCDDDLFQVSGRASWLLKELTGQDLGSIAIQSTATERTKLRDLWLSWLARKGVD